MRGSREKALEMRIYSQPQKDSPFCRAGILLISFMNLTSWWRAKAFNEPASVCQWELVIIVYYFNKSPTILSLPVPIWYNDSLNIQSCAAVK